MFTAIKLFFGGLPLANIKNYLLIGAIISTGLMYFLWQLEKVSHKLTVSEYSTLSATNAAVNAIQAKHREKITADVVNSYAQSIDEVNKYYAQNPTIKLRTVRVRDNTGCTASTTERESAERVDTGHNGTEKAIATELATEVQIDFEKAGKEIVQCLELIKFNKEQDNVQ